VSEREKYGIAGLYYTYVTGELDQAIPTYELWADNYPHDLAPSGNLGFIYAQLGQYDKSLTNMQEALRVEPNMVVGYSNLAGMLLALGRPDDAMKAVEQARLRKLESDDLHEQMYSLAFFKGDAAEMERQVAWAASKPGAEESLLSIQSDTDAYYGRLPKSRDFSQRAVESAFRNDSKETAAVYQSKAALREAEFGNAAIAKQDVAAALALAPGRGMKPLAALALARAGEVASARPIVEELEKNYPLDTIMKFYWIPSIKAAMALAADNPVQAIMFLEAASPYELGAPPQFIATMYPVYIRGQAQLAAGNGGAATREFQKFLDHRGVALNYPLAALARLGLARAYALESPSDPTAHDKARAAYLDFLTLWKDADPDIPILKQAKAEYAKLK